MTQLPDQERSYWVDSSITPRYSELREDTRVDVAIVGAGIVGLTAAYLLKKAGKTVAVLDKDSVGEGVTGHTTGKITSQHNLIYAKLEKRLGSETAKKYGQANQKALEDIASIVKVENIDCEFRRLSNYVYTADASRIDEFKNEAAVASALGLPAEFTTKTDLPYEVKAAVRFENQATFHVRKYLLALARLVDGGGSRVHENSMVIGIRDGAPGRVKTAKAKVVADNILVATNVPTLPLMARGTYCVAEYPLMSYIVAGKIDKPINGMYISPDKDHYSLLPVDMDGDKYLLIGGEGHIPGTRLNKTTRYERLANYAKKHFGITDIDYTWKHRDYLGYDDMPLIGKTYPWSKNSYTATGFMKWGLTNGTMAAYIMTDQVLGNPSPYSETFSPHRMSTVASIPKVIKETLS